VTSVVIRVRRLPIPRPEDGQGAPDHFRRLRAGDTPDRAPDGSRILFHSNNRPKKDGVSGNLYTIRPDGSGLRQLTFADDGVTQHLGSSYSPDGTMITFARRPATGGSDLNTADVFTMWVDGTHVTHVTRTKKYDSFPDWGPSAH
jgi:TolB protein